MKHRIIVMLSVGLLALFVPAVLAQDAPPTPDNTQWQLVSLAGTDLVADTTITLIFTEDGTAAGSAGCNSYSVPYTIDEGRIDFGMGISTMMACEDAIMQQESAYLAALDAATDFTLRDAQLVITSAEGDELVFALLPGLAGTQWEWVTLAGDNVLSEMPATIAFDDESRATGNTGCNLFNASYTAEGERLSFGEALLTRRACMDETLADQEMKFLDALAAATAFRLAEDSLTITTNEGEELVFTRMMTLTDTEWTLTTLTGEDVLTDTTITLTFDAGEGRIFGDSGCNRYNGSYSADAETLSITQVISTRMACPEPIMAQEMAYLQALEAVAGFELADNTLTLTTAEGAQLVFAQVRRAAP